VSIVIFSDAATRSTAETICRAVPDALHLARLSLPEVAAALSLCKVFLGGDTGLGHIASAVGCAMVTLSPHPEDGDPGHSNSPDRFRPFTDRAVLLRPAHGRRGCEEGCDAAEPHCILDITPEQAASAVLEFLEP
jgi:heptosyltransferase-2